MPHSTVNPHQLWLDRHGVILVYLADSNRILELNGWAADHFRLVAANTPGKIMHNAEIAQLENQLRDLGVFV
jgi:hypothetical protein